MYYLGLIVANEYDKDFKLKAFKTIEELDAYTSTFESSEEIRKAYEEDIAEFMIDNIPLIKKHETKNNKQRGSICAYYYDKYGIDFLEVSYRDKKAVRDYRELATPKEQIDFLYSKLNNKIKRIDKIYKYNRDRAYARIVKRELAKYHYYVSDEMMYYLTIFFSNIKNPSESEKYLNFVKTRIKQLVKERHRVMQEEKKEQKKDAKKDKKVEEAKEVKEYDESIEYDDSEEVIFREGADDAIVDDYQKALDTKDFDEFFKNHSLDELDSHIHLERIGHKEKVERRK